MNNLQFYERYEDMSRTGRLRLLMDNDGDVCITIVPDYDPNNLQSHLTLEFCTYQGGGRSQKVRQKLIELADAVEEENKLNPQYRD